MGFDQIAQDLAREFLQTIVVVDDQADYGLRQVEPEGDTNLVEPDEISFVGAAPAPQLNAVPDSFPNATVSDADLETHALDAKLLIDRFADEGIVCSVIRPSDHEMEQLTEKICTVAGRADIVVLDWVMHGDESGERTLEIITSLAEAPKQHRRSRLIAVYSGQRQPIDIRDSIEKQLKATESATEPTERRDDYTLVRGPVRIAIFSKRYVPTVEGVVNRKFSEGELPARLIAEFAQMTNGIVPNVVVDALAQIRRNTHRLLSTFHRGLDSPFLNHRAMLTEPDDAKSFIRSLVAAEIGSLLDEYDVGARAVSPPSIKAWLEREAKARTQDGNDDVFPLIMGKDELRLNAEGIGTLIESGAATWNGASVPVGERAKWQKAIKKNGHKMLTGALVRTGETASELDNEFAALSALRTRYRDSNAPPMLTLGTIVRRREELGHCLGPAEPDTYWLCVQASCDSVRIDNPRKFPLLPLHVVSESEKFNLIIRGDQDQYIRVQIGNQPYLLDLVLFAPSGGRVVRAERRGDRFVFVPSEGKYSYEWVADLRFEHSHRATNEHAARASRIGLDEYEWLRRWAS
jgi:hypothetical protein